MAKLFYDHLLIIEEITVLLDKQDLKPKDRDELLALVHETLEHEILDVIATYLPREHHEEFFTRLHAAPHDPEIMQFLKDHAVVNIELAILDRANKTKKKLMKEFKT